MGYPVAFIILLNYFNDEIDATGFFCVKKELYVAKMAFSWDFAT